MTGMDRAAMLPSIMSGSDIRDTPPCARMSAGTRSRAITATAPASSAIFACSAVTTSMITPPLSISAIPRLARAVPVTWDSVLTCSDMWKLLARLSRAIVRGIQPGYRRPVRIRWPVARRLTGREGLALARLGPVVHRRVVDVEEPGQRMATRQPQQPYQRTAAHRQGVANQVAVHLAGQCQAAAGLGNGRQGTRPGPAGHRPQGPGQVVLGFLAVVWMRAQHRLGRPLSLVESPVAPQVHVC